MPRDHRLRKIAGVLDLGFVREAVAGTYGQRGHVSEDPVVVLKLMLLLFLDDIKSERELMRMVPLRLDYLWFLGLGLEDEVAHHSVLSKARARWGERLFEELFVRSVHQCVEAGLVEGNKLHVDSSLVDANASRGSVLKASPELMSRLKEAYAAQTAKLEESNVPSQEATVNERMMSTSDPDAAMARKGPGDVSRPRYHHHRALDDAHGVIVALESTPGHINEATRLGGLVDQAQSNMQSKVQTVVADRQYGTAANFVALAGQGIATHMGDLRARQRNVQCEGIFGEEQFGYDPVSDTYRCPAGESLKPVGWDGLKHSWRYRAPARVCARCVLRAQCTRSQHGRSVWRHAQEELLRKARRQSHSREGRMDRRRRMHLMERSFAEAANQHGFKRSRWRRLWRQRIQDWLIALVQNLRILLQGPRLSPAQSLAVTSTQIIAVLSICAQI
jgi:transposase